MLHAKQHSQALKEMVREKDMKDKEATVFKTNCNLK
jgi:hypothetical protein